jgi:hypothetical protein
MARQLVEKYIFTPGAASVGTLKFPGKCDLTQLLIIANKTNQTNLYAIGDPTRSGTITFDPTDTTTFNSVEGGVSTLTFSADTSMYLSSDKIAIYTDAPKNQGNITRPYAFGVDAIERMRVASPQALIDADFEYGLQPTKWQNYFDQRNIPGIFEKPGLDLFVTDITTDGSSPSLITVTCSAAHGLSAANPVIIYGLANTASSSRAEGAFVINTVTTYSFTYFAKGIVGTNGLSLYNASTYARRGGFYSGASIPSYSFSSDGNSPSKITVVCSGNHGLVPGCPIVGVAITSGTNHNLLTGNFYAETVPTQNTFTFTARVGGAIDNGNRSALSGVAISGTAGQFTCSATTLAAGDVVTITGTFGGTGSITGYGSGIIYRVSAVTGTSPNVTGFTLVTNSVAGNALVTTAGTPTGLTYTPATRPNMSVYTRSDSFVLHRPFDGGVQLGNFVPTHGASVSRQTKKYMRYQSGKGLLWTSGVLFNPVINLDQIYAAGTTTGSLITVTTEIDHGLQAGSTVEIAGVLTSGYNGVYGVNSIISETVFTVVAGSALGSASAVITSFPRVTCTQWSGATVRCGPFDEQNGVFWEYDGKELAVVKRSATYQLSSYISVTPGSQVVVGSGSCRFTQQLKQGDNIVIRGMTYKVNSITDDNNMTINPEYRGVNPSSSIKYALINDQRVPQSQFNIDKFDGTGTSGFKVQLNKMQMMGISYSWYGAGFIDFMMRGADGNMVVAHRMKQNNINDEAYMRTGNASVRYQVKNESASAVLTQTLGITDTTIYLDDASRFPTTGGTVMIENELINYSGVSGNLLTGCTRGASMTQYVGGKSQIFSGQSAGRHDVGNGKQAVWLVSCTASPTICHWGSSYIMDGGFDNDRGYYFNYAQTGISLTGGQSKTAFFIRLAPSVSNSISGSLGDRDLINRSLLLLQRLQVQSDKSVQVYGILNPGNIDSASLSWTSVNSVSLGSQPSFAQISTTSSTAATPGEQNFSTLGQPNGFAEIDLSQLKELSNSSIGGYANYPDGPDMLAVVVKNLDSNTANANINLFWSEAQA